MAVSCLVFVCACNNADNSNSDTIKNLQQQIADLQEVNKNFTDRISELQEENQNLTDRLDKLQEGNQILEYGIGGLGAKSKSAFDAKAVEIKIAYYNANKEHFVSKYYTCTAEDITLYYYGEYNDASIVRIYPPYAGYPCVEMEQEIDGVTIRYSSPPMLEVYYDGSFYSLDKAFENGYIDHGNLVDISNNFSHACSFPYPAKSVMDRIKSAYYEIHKDNGWFENYTADDVGVSLYGEYRGAYVMFIGPPIFAANDVITVQNIDGVKIIYPDSSVMEVFYGGKFYSLEEAFNKRYLLHDELVDIRNKHKANHSYLYN